MLMPYTKINSKLIKDLNVRPDIIKLLEENICRMLFDIIHTNVLSLLSLRVRDTKMKINKRDLIKIKVFCTEKETQAKEKTIHKMGENICKLCDQQGIISKIYKQVTQLNIIKVAMKNGQKMLLNRRFSEEKQQMANR